MCDVCGGCHIGSGTHTCFIAEQSPLDALHQCDTYTATQCLLPAEGMADDEFDNGRKFSDVDSYNNQCQSNISQCHNGDNNAAHFSNALYTTEDNKQRGYGNNPSYDGMVETERMFKSCTQRIALYGVEGEAESDRNEYGKYSTHPRLFQSFPHIISGTANERVFASHLI